MSRSGIMLCHPFEEARLQGESRKAWNRWPVIVQPKLDGARCRIVINGRGEPILLSSEENIIYSMPHLQDAVRKLNLTDMELDGELYCHGMNFENIMSRVGCSVNVHPDHMNIGFHCFDLVQGGSQMQRLGAFADLTSKWEEPLFKVPYWLCYTFEDILLVYDSILKEGYEGIIVRHVDAPYVRKRSTFMMKFKPKQEDIYEIVGYEEEVSQDGVLKAALGAFICSSDEGTQFNVGSGFNKADRDRLWRGRNDCIGKRLRVAYQHITAGKGVPRFPVFVEVIEDGE